MHLEGHLSHRIIALVLCLALLLQASPVLAGPAAVAEASVRSTAPAQPKAEGALVAAATALTHDLRSAPEPVAVLETTTGDATPRRTPDLMSPASLRALAHQIGAIPPQLQKPLSAAEENRLYPPAMPGGPDPRMAVVGDRTASQLRLQATSEEPVTALTLEPGWHLLSLPLLPEATDPAAVLAPIEGSYGVVYAYEGCDTADPLKRYDPADLAGSDLTTIDHTLGFWVEMKVTDTLTFTGTQPVETQIPLCQGWNLIGYPQDRSLPVPGALHTIAGQFLRVFGWDLAGAADPWALYDVTAPDWASDLPFMAPGQGYWVFATADTTLTLRKPGPPPVVDLLSPTEGSEITTFITATGTISAETVAEWELAYRVEGTDTWTSFASGDTSTSDQVQGIFDPSMLLNDLYEIQLTATDVFGQAASQQVDVLLSGEQKIGLFTLSFVDLAIPVAGIPLAFIRTYDSRDKSQGEFGIGWTLDILRGTYRNNRKPGDGWIVRSSGGPFPLPCTVIDETKHHVTEIRFSDVEYYRFKLDLVNFAPLSGSCVGQAQFVQIGGVPGATLIAEGSIDVRYDPGTDQIVNLETGQTYEPAAVQLTTLDGRTFDLTLSDGVGRVSDPNGNTLVIGEGGVTHSSGKSVQITRDEHGRITQIIDPKGNTIGYTYDANGDLIAHTDQEKHITQFTYHPNHYLKEIIDPRQIPVSRIEYNDEGRMVAIVDVEGNRTEFTHNVSDREEIVVDSRNHVTRYLYDERGNVLLEETTVTIEGETVPVVTSYEYDERDNLTTVVDADGVRHEAEYDANDLPIRVAVDPDGLDLVTSYAYHTNGEVLTQTTPAGNVITFTYDTAGNMESLLDPLGNAISVERNSQGRITRNVDAQDNVTEMTYDSNGYMTGETVSDADGNILRQRTFTVDANGNRLTETLVRVVNGVERSLTTRYAYDAKNRLISVTDPLGNVTRIEYNAFGREAARIDALERRTEFEYDSLGRLVKTLYPDQTFTTMEYDEAGNVASVTDQAKRTTRYEYDELNRRVRTLYPDGAIQETIYSPGGRVVAEIDARGNRTEFAYDAPGRLVGTTLPQIFDITTGTMVTPHVTQEYDAEGNRTAIVEADDTRTAFSYNNARQITQIHYPDGSTQSQRYDELGRVVEIDDELGRTTHLGYDALDRLITVTLPAPAPGEPNPTTTYTYDAAGNKLTQTDALGRTTRFRYDELNRLVEHTLPGGETEYFTYDEVGNLITHRNFNGQTLVYDYDERNRLERTYLPGGEEIVYTYTPTGRRHTVIDARGETSYTYDERDRLASVVQPTSEVISYTYDLNGNLTGITSPGGGVAYEYNALNALARVIEPGATTSYGYDSVGNLRQMTAGDGTITDYAFDARRRLTSIAHRAADGTPLASFAYGLLPTGHRDSVTELDGSVVNYSYDELNRLTGETRTGSVPYDIAYAYDLVGNRTLMTDGGVETSYTYDVNDRLHTAGDLTFAYDANGNTLSVDGGDVSLSYGWDALNRLIRVSDGVATTTYTYDADGNRVLASGPDGDIAYLVDLLNGTGYAQVLEERAGDGNLLARYTYGVDLLGVSRDGTNHFYHYDGGLSTRLLTAGGSVTNQYTYDAFGNLRTSTGSTANNYLYAGEQFDPAADAYYLRARYYNPAVGRFLSRDPFGGMAEDPFSLHKYLYAHATPVNAIDPSGEMTLFGLSISSAISRSLRGMSYTRIAKSVCQIKETAANMGTLLILGKVLKGLKGLSEKVSPYANIGFDLTQYGQSGNLSGQQLPIPGTSYNIEVEHPLAKFPNAARTLDRDAMKKVSIKQYLKLVQTSAGSMTPWMDISIETFQGTSIGSSFPYMSVTLDEFVREAEFSAGATLFSHTVDACGLPLITFGANLETKHKVSSGESAAGVIAKLVALGFLEVKATLLDLKSGGQ